VLLLCSVNGTTYTTSAIASVVDGDDQDGITVKATFADGSTQTQIWAPEGGGQGGVFGTGWSLGVSGDTISSNWDLLVDNTLSLTSLEIDGVGGDIVFDRFTSPPSTGTANSSIGLDFEEVTTSFVQTATYSNRVALTSDPTNPFGDVFTKLTLGFGNGFNGQLFYKADTDPSSTLIAGTTPPPTGTPEPSAVLGLLALGLVGRRLGSKAR